MSVGVHRLVHETSFQIKKYVPAQKRGERNTGVCRAPSRRVDLTRIKKTCDRARVTPGALGARAEYSFAPSTSHDRFSPLSLAAVSIWPARRRRCRRARRECARRAARPSRICDLRGKHKFFWTRWFLQPQDERNEIIGYRPDSSRIRATRLLTMARSECGHCRGRDGAGVQL